MRFLIIFLLFFSPLLVKAADSHLSMKEKEVCSSGDLDSQISNLKKLKKYYESLIKRASRTAWRLEFKDPGYSRQLDQKVIQYKEQLNEINKQLDEKMCEKEQRGS